METYKGYPASRGVAIGKAMLYHPYTPDLSSRTSGAAAASRLAAYDAAKEQAGRELENIQANMKVESPSKAAIFAAHIDILNDVVMDGEVRSLLKNEQLVPSSAVAEVFTRYADILSNVDDSLIQERASDILDVRNRLMRILEGHLEQSLADLSEPRIVIANDLLPSDTASMNRSMVMAIVCEVGGSTSHTAIIARSYGIPALLGLNGAMNKVADGKEVIVDSCEGILITGADDALTDHYIRKLDKYRKQTAIIMRYADNMPVTTDGVRIEVGANIVSANDDLPVIAARADSVGLFRTEFLFMGRKDLPSEEEQVEAYRRVLSAFGEKAVVLRTLDIGGDKECESLHLPQEENPFLGNRALRFCFSRQDIFRIQLRAAYRASTAGNLWLMLPMVSSLGDIKRAKAIIADVLTELDQEGKKYCHNTKFGVMIEIPAIAILADQVAKEVDFASIGSNDLCQYTLAVDRMNPAVTDYYQSYHPAMFRLMRYVIEQFHTQGKPIGICGELGGEPEAAAALMGLGIRKLSVGPESLPVIKKLICTHSIRQMEQDARHIADFSFADDIFSYLSSQYQMDR